MGYIVLPCCLIITPQRVSTHSNNRRRPTANTCMAVLPFGRFRIRVGKMASSIFTSSNSLTNRTALSVCILDVWTMMKTALGLYTQINGRVSGLIQCLAFCDVTSRGKFVAVVNNRGTEKYV